ncbi:hypothetical protein BJX99DRAFT_233151 [Aspergillus californicus]
MMGSGLLSLPPELSAIVISYLHNKEVKVLRLTCRHLCQTTRLRFDRVFLSPNPTNISVFRAVASHEFFRHGVTEIIYDDARLFMHDSGEFDREEGCPAWFAKECRGNIFRLCNFGALHQRPQDHLARIEQFAAQPPLKICWQHYQNLIHQQAEAVLSNSDRDTLVYGLKRFPRLRRVTVTVAAHGSFYAPLYPTPMIRTFPRGFNYPLPRGLPVSNDHGCPHFGRPCEKKKTENWRGYWLVTRVLAEQARNHSVTELIIDVNGISTGLPSAIFEAPCEEYEHLRQILQQPGFTRLDLPLSVDGQEYPPIHEHSWSYFRGTYLRHALEDAKDLASLNLWTDVCGGSRKHLMPMSIIFPVQSWTKLRHFGITGFPVDQADMIAFLALLPKTIRSVKLGLLRFVDYGGNWTGLLTDMRDQLGWRERDDASRPRVILELAPSPLMVGMGVQVLEEAVDDFLYGSGPNPIDWRYPDGTIF